MKMIAKMVKGLPVILAVVFLCGLIFSQSPVLANDQYEKRIDRIDEALREGQISLKTAVLQKAKILFSPHRALLEGEDIGDDTPRLALFEDVRRVFEKLTGKEKRYLSSLSPELAGVINEEGSGEQAQQTHVTQRLPTTFDRVSRARDHGEITLKEAVLLKARLLFVPHTIETQHPFSVEADEIPVHEESLTGFYKDVHRVFDQLTPEEISFLGSLSPDLKVIMTTKEQERSGTDDPLGTSALPSYPDLDQQEEGRNCIVHYALTGANAVPNKTYAELVRLYMDKAIGSGMTTKDFTKAYAEGYADFAGKMHVYLLNMNGGEWVDASTVSGKKKAGYIKLTTNVKNNWPDSWQLWLKGALFHEYFHGIQSAYNWASDLWFMEATTIWAQCYYAQDYMHIKQFYDAPDSVFKTPNDILWSTAGFRKYSTSALAFYLSDKFGGHKFIKSYFVNSETEDDGVKILEKTLNAKDTVFTEEYIYFLASLYSKKIASIKKYMPDVKIETTYNAYGLDKTSGNVSLTGANFYAFDPQTGAKPGTFIATFTAGATGLTKGALVQQKGSKKSNTPIAFLPHVSGSPTAYFGGFGGTVKKVVLIATDATYSAKDTALRSYEYTAIVPSIFIREVTAQSPIFSGDSSQINIRYDLTGTIPGKPFPVYLKVVEKGPDVSDYASGELNLPSGMDQLLNLWFNTSSSTVGNYRFTFQLAVPPDSWLPIPQVKSKGKCSVLVKKPSAGAMARQATAREIGRPTLTIKK